MSAWATSRCEDGQPRPSVRGHPQAGASTEPAAPLKTNPLVNLEPLSPPKAISLTEDQADLFWALARCNCAPSAVTAYLQEVAVSRGTLPQPLVPTIRQQIRSDSKLQVLDHLPNGLSDLMTGFFANDKAIASAIRSGVDGKITKYAPGSPRLAKRLSFRFDGFPKLGSQTKISPDFRVSDQLARWHAVFATDALWLGKSPLGGDHGLQTLETMRTLVEWKYMMGLDENPEGGFYGGLTLDASDGGQTLAGSFDPRTDPQGQRFFSGTYTINFPDRVSALQLATEIQESWTVQVAPVSLSEQAQIWHTTALAFRRLRPEQRRFVPDMFGNEDSALFPRDTHQLALAFLPGLSALLNGPFIEKESRLIRRYAKFNAEGSNEPASLQDLARLLAALVAWSDELENLQDADIGQDAQTSLGTGRIAMRKAAQLATQTILHRFTQVSPNYGIALGTSSSSPASIAQASETLLALVSAEQGALTSPFLQERIVAIFHWLVGDVLAPMFNQNRSFSAHDLVWAHAALEAFAPYADDYGDDWYQPMREAMAKQVSAWDRGTP